MLNKILAKRLPVTDVEELKVKVVRLILERSSPDAVYIFGSAVRNEMTTSSDIDVACIFEGEQAAKTARSELRGLSAALGWPVDLLIYDEETFMKQAEIGGICHMIKYDGSKVA